MDKRPITLVFIITSLLLGILILSASMMVEESRVNWLHNYDEGLSKVRTVNKLVLIYFHADWCSWCKKLDREIFNNQDIASFLNEKLVCIKINVEENLRLSETHGVYSVPAIVFLSANGVEVGRHGYLPSSQFLEYAMEKVKQYG